MVQSIKQLIQIKKNKYCVKYTIQYMILYDPMSSWKIIFVKDDIRSSSLVFFG